MSAISAVVVAVHFPHLAIIPSEIIGTAILILLGDGVVAAVLLSKSKAENSGWIVITFGWGMAVMVAVYAVGFFSGAQLNPAVTLGVWIHGGINGSQAWHYWVGEIIGAMVGAFLVYIAYYLHWSETDDPGLKLAVFSTGPAIRNYGVEPGHRDRRHVRAGVRSPRDHALRGTPSARSTSRP